MLASLSLFINNKQWRAELLICPSSMIKLHSIVQQFNGSIGDIYYCTEQFPLGLAFEMVERWNRNYAYSKKLMNETIAISEMEAIIQKFTGKKSNWNVVSSHHFSVENADEIKERIFMHFIRMMQGRALISQEINQMLEEQQILLHFSWKELVQLGAWTGKLQLKNGLQVIRQHRRKILVCRRCGSSRNALQRNFCLACGQTCFYCTACLQMGKIRECEMLIVGSQPYSKIRSTGQAAEPAQLIEQWKLSDAQAVAASSALAYVQSQAGVHSEQSKGRLFNFPKWMIPFDKQQPLAATFLLWAVTGAGKTEMIFPLVEYIVNCNGKVLIASPRRDVVIELDPRIRKAFPKETVVTLYGGSSQRWHEGTIFLSTTHQLLRFQEGFDLVIIDEIDAFPYHGNPMLYFAAHKCVSKNGVKVLLSATPPSYLQRKATWGRLPHARVPVRYHRHPLPVPQYIRSAPVHQLLQQRKLSKSLLDALEASLTRGAQLFVFVQRIAQTERFKELLKAYFPNISIEATSSKDEERSQKVTAFRSCEIRILVTTTILERGVTIPRSDVFIFDADGKLFDEASLIQMGGRAGRSGDDPKGNVYFIAKEMNQSQKKAIKHISAMNKLAARHGFLRPEYRKEVHKL